MTKGINREIVTDTMLADYDNGQQLQVAEVCVKHYEISKSKYTTAPRELK